MAENQVKYYVRIDDKYVEADMKKSEDKITGKQTIIANTAKKTGESIAGAHEVSSNKAGGFWAAAATKMSGSLGIPASAAAVSAAAIGAAFAGVAIASGKLGSAFENSMAKASTLIDTSAVDIDGVGDKILALSDKSGIAADALGNTMYNALSAGVQMGKDGADMMAFLEKNTRIAKAGVTDVDTATIATAKVLNAYKMSVQDTDKVHKILMQTQNKGITTVGELSASLAQVTPTAAAMNVSFEQVGAALATMTTQGTPTAQATTQLNSLFAELGKQGTNAQKALLSATEGTKYAAMGFQDMMAAGVPLNEILDLMGISADTSDQSLIDMFGSLEAGKAALAMSGKNSQQFTENLTAMSVETDVVGKAFDEVSSTISEKLAKIMNVLKNVLIELFLAVEPLISLLLDIFVPVLTVVAQSIGLVFKAFREVVDFVLEGVSAAFAQLPEAWQSVCDWFTESLPALSEFFAGIWQGICDFFIGIWNSISEANQTFLLALLESFTEILTNISTFFTAIWQDMCDWFRDAMNNISTTFTSVWNGIKSFAQFIWDSMGAVLSGAISGYIAAFHGFLSSVQSIWDNIKSVFDGVISFIRGVFTGNWTAAWNGIKQIFSGIVNSFVSIFRAPINGMIDLINGFLSGLNSIKIPDWVPGVGGKGFHVSLIPRLEKGLDFVPEDYFPAYLDYGERVLTKEENHIFNALGGFKGIETALTGASSAPQHIEYHITDDHSTKIDQPITFENPMQAPDEIARALRLSAR
ncbi:MAG: phage tail tape measure protein, partial [Ruthenibacterium sp.]